MASSRLPPWDSPPPSRPTDPRPSQLPLGNPSSCRPELAWVGLGCRVRLCARPPPAPLRRLIGLRGGKGVVNERKFHLFLKAKSHPMDWLKARFTTATDPFRIKKHGKFCSLRAKHRKFFDAKCRELEKEVLNFSTYLKNWFSVLYIRLTGIRRGGFFGNFLTNPSSDSQ